jgi:hypothetical protein
VVDGTYEDAAEAARWAATDPGALEIADVGDSDTARWVIEGYSALLPECELGGLRRTDPDAYDAALALALGRAPKSGRSAAPS